MEQHELVDKPLLTVSAKGSFNTHITDPPIRKFEQPFVTGSGPAGRKGSRISALWRHGWTAETCACIFALCALVGLIVVLLRLQNRPLPDWPHAVTVNSIVSIFALLIRASVGIVLAEGISQSKWQWFRRPRQLADMERFDAASRGAWGSILLLCRFAHKRFSWIAALGAIITIVASLLGFFAQQLVQFQDCLQQYPNAMVGISTTHNYNASGPPIYNMENDMYPPMVAAINNGIVQSESVPNYDNVISHNCNSGNCTFPSDGGASYSTLGVSHSCENVTSQVVEWHWPGPMNATQFTAYLNTTRAGNVSLGYPGPTAFSTGSMGSAYGDNTLVTVKMIYKRSSLATNYSAISCSLFPTVKTYGVNITRSVMHEQLVNERRIGSNVLGPTNDSYIRFKLATSTTLRNGKNTTCERKQSAAPGYTQVALGNVDAAPASRNLSKEELATWYYPNDCVYSLSKFSIDGIEAYFSEVFDDKKLIWAGRLGGNQGSIYLRQFFQGGNMTLSSVDKIFANIATAMSVTIRTNGAEGTAGYAKGVMWYDTTCMRVKWGWISFPAALIGLSAAFLVLVAIESRGTESDRLWKSSVLATLFCDVEQVDEHGIRPEGKQAMSDIAHSTSVSLGGGEGALRFVSR